MRAIASDDTQHRTTWAMPRIPTATPFASAAARVDLSDYTLTHQMKRTGRALHYAYKLMPDCSFKPCVPAHNLHIRITDARKCNAHHSFPFIQGFGNLS